MRLALPIAHTWDGQPVPPAEQVQVWLSADSDGLWLELVAPFHGDPPPEGPPGPTWGLWDHEVVELFVLGPGERYTEVELGPHGHHLLLRLQGRRQVVDKLLPLDVQVARTADRWTARVHLPSSCLPERPWRGNAYAIHGTGAARRYLAWTPPGGPTPDFHRLETFPPLDLPPASVYASE